jgi:predicted transcriptional regulator of viral defense system
MTTTPEATRRARANKRKGAQWQSDVRNVLRSAAYDVEILELSGKEDEGDLVVRLGNGRYIIIEAKNEQAINISGYLAEASVEADHFAAHRPAVDRENVQPVAVVKARGKSTEDSYVLIRFRDFFEQVGA